MRKIVMFGVAGVIALTVLVSLLGQSPKSSPTKEFMRQKLAHSQRVLEGIVMEDFELVGQQARKLSAMSQAANWRAFDNPEYAQHSDTFRRNADTLVKAAADHNLDGATLAYVKVTMSCVECHKFVRGKRVAWFEKNTPKTRSSSLPQANDRRKLEGVSL